MPYLFPRPNPVEIYNLASDWPRITTPSDPNETICGRCQREMSHNLKITPGLLTLEHRDSFPLDSAQSRRSLVHPNEASWRPKRLRLISRADLSAGYLVFVPHPFSVFASLNRSSVPPSPSQRRQGYPRTLPFWSPPIRAVMIRRTGGRIDSASNTRISRVTRVDRLIETESIPNMHFRAHLRC